MVRLWRDQRGVSMPVLSLFLVIALFWVFWAWSLLAMVWGYQAASDSALQLALSAAVANGTIATAPGVVVWSPSAALNAAIVGVSQQLPVVLASQEVNGATFTPGHTAPPNWGTVSLTNFATVDAGIIPTCSGGVGTIAGETSVGPYVEADLTIPFTISFFGANLSLNTHSCLVDAVTTARITGNHVHFGP